MTGAEPGPQDRTAPVGWADLLGLVGVGAQVPAPPDPDGRAVLRAAQASLSGDLRVWELVPVPDSGVTVSCHRLGPDRVTWTSSGTGLDTADPLDALGRSADLCTLWGDVVTVFACEGSGLDASVVVDRLRVAGAAADECGWPWERPPDWAEECGELGDRYPDLSFHHVYALIDDLAVTAVVPGGGQEPVAVLADYSTPGDADLFVLADLAEYTWCSESGGAPISWDGGAPLRLLSSGLVLDVAWGDVEPGQSIGRWPGPDTERAATVADWVSFNGAEVAAALALEPLEPAGAVEAAARNRLRSALGELTFSVVFGLPDSVLADLRGILSARSVYAATARALREPSGALGRRLRRAVDRALQDGVTGSLIQGDWIDAPVDAGG